MEPVLVLAEPLENRRAVAVSTLYPRGGCAGCAVTSPALQIWVCVAVHLPRRGSLTEIHR